MKVLSRIGIGELGSDLVWNLSNLIGFNNGPIANL